MVWVMPICHLQMTKRSFKKLNAGATHFYDLSSILTLVRENIKAPWYNEWDRYTQQQVQEALLKRIDPRKALENWATRARDLKRQWK